MIRSNFSSAQTKIKKLVKRVALSAISIFAVVVMPLSTQAASTVVYDATPNPVPPNMASLGFQATQTSEFGDYVHLAGTNRKLDSVTVTMSNWALQATPANVTFCLANPLSCSADGFKHPITLNIYNVVPGSPLNTKGSLVATVTKVVDIPWRPVADPSCGTAWKASDNNCYNGFAFNATFDMSSLNTTLPNDVIVGVAYNTQSYGTAPIGVDGPYNSLNVGVVGTPVVGSDGDSDRVFWNTITAGWYTDGGVGGVGIFREDNNWTPYGTTPIKITASSVMPASKDECKKDGWKSFGTTFKNQGDCVSFVATQGRNQPSGN